MKIAVAVDCGRVAEHFGHCEGFEVFQIEDGQITAKNFVPNPGHRPGFLPNFLGDMGVSVVIAGGMGESAVRIFKERGIEVLTGLGGSSQEEVELYLAGKSKSEGIVCREHQGYCQGYCRA